MAVLAVIGIHANPYLSSVEAATTEPDSIVDAEPARIVRLDVFLDRVMVLVSERMDSTMLAALAAEFSMTVDQRYPQGLAVFKMASATTRKAALAKARLLAADPRNRVLRAGLVVSAPGPYSPMGVFDEIIVGIDHGAHIPTHQFRGWVHDGTPFNPYRPDHWGFHAVADTAVGAFEACRLLASIHGVQFAVPNLYHVIHLTSDPSAEPEFQRQWHLKNSGEAGGTPDADIDADRAWDYSKGNGVVVAVTDGGFDVDHHDLTANLWSNPTDVCDGTDNDNNGFLDDLHGYDFHGEMVGCGSKVTSAKRCYPCWYTPTSVATCSDGSDPAACGDLRQLCLAKVPDDLHGTAVAGIIAARGDNGYGGTGVAPEAKLMLLRSACDEKRLGTMFDYARVMGASVINCSWRLLPWQVLLEPARLAVKDAAQRGRDGKGCVIVLAMTDSTFEECTGARSFDDLLMLPRDDGDDACIAVSGSDNLDRKAVNTGYGNCMDILAPTNGGTLSVATTDYSSKDGYNSKSPFHSCPAPPGLPKESDSTDFTYCFSGTSAAAPMVSGVAALILAVNPEMTAPQVKRLIQDTADKTEDATGALAGRYDDNTGYSRGPSGVSTHGWGRLNAFEAVGLAAPAASGGHGGTDLLVRDHRLDWGNTEQPSSVGFEPTRTTLAVTSSVDVKVDGFPFQTTTSTSAGFDALTDETFVRGQKVRIYVRVRNRGWVAASAVTVRAAVSYPGATLDRLPSDFWTNFDKDSWTEGAWHRGGSAFLKTVPYSGPSGITETADPASIATIEFTAPNDGGTSESACVLVTIDCSADPAGAKIRAGAATDADLDIEALCAADNNIALKRR